MNKTVKIASATLAALALAVVPALSAQATSGITQSNLVSTDTWDYQYGSALSPDGKIQAILPYNTDEVWLAYVDNDAVVKVTDSNNDIDEPYGAAFSPDGTKLYVTQYGYDTVIIDVATKAVIDTISGINPCSENLAIGISPDGKYLVQADDCDDVYVYDIANNYAQVGSSDGTSTDAIDIFFPNSTQAYLVEDDGTIEILDLATSTITDTWAGNTSSYGSCTNADVSVVAVTPDNSSDTLDFITPSTGAVLASVDVSTITDFAGAQACAFSGNGKLLMTDWSRSDAVMYVFNSSTYAYEETVDVDLNGTGGDGAPTNSINVMKGCKVFLPGYNGNLAVMQMPSDYCPAALPDTGASSTLIITLVSVGGGLLALGIIAMVIVRRRNAKA